MNEVFKFAANQAMMVDQNYGFDHDSVISETRNRIWLINNVRELYPSEFKSVIDRFHNGIQHFVDLLKNHNSNDDLSRSLELAIYILTNIPDDVIKTPACNYAISCLKLKNARQELPADFDWVDGVLYTAEQAENDNINSMDGNTSESELWFVLNAILNGVFGISHMLMHDIKRQCKYHDAYDLYIQTFSDIIQI